MTLKNKTILTKRLFNLFRAAFLIGLCFSVLFPLILKLLISFRSYEDIMDSSIILLPKNFTFDTFSRAMSMMSYNKAIVNTAWLSIASGIIHVVSCLFTSYSLAKFEFKGKKLILVLVVLTFIVPQTLVSVPTYAVFKNFTFFGLLKPIFPDGLQLLNNPAVLLLLYGTANAFKSGLYIFLLMQFFRSLPKELDEAAAVDGASNSRILFTIAIPMARVMLITVFLFTFVWQWTDLQYTSMFLPNFEMLSVKLSNVGHTLSANMAASREPANPLLISQIVSAGSIVFMAPLLIVYVICNKFFVQGIERSGIVG